jgi:quinol-cytochrome oxidoreductase complex cytochrome b subunit
MWHILLLPLVVSLLVGIHVLLVRRRGVVPPFAADQPAGAPAATEVPENPGGGVS